MEDAVDDAAFLRREAALLEAFARNDPSDLGAATTRNKAMRWKSIATRLETRSYGEPPDWRDAGLVPASRVPA